MQRILVVDDDRMQVDVVSFLLRREGFEPVAAFDAPTAVRLFTEQAPELVILDVQLGDADGRELLRQFRKERPEVSILMLTALGAEEDRVYGLDLGADDYLAKPFGHRELLARVRALLRRGNVEQQGPTIATRLQLGSVVLDPATHEATRNGRRLDLSPTEFRLLQTLLEHPGQLVSTRTLLKTVWGHQDLTARNVLRVTASRLRAKLQDDPSSPPMLQTVPSEGLMIQSDEPPGRPNAPSTDEPIVDMDVVRELQELLQDMGSHPLRQMNDTFVKFAQQQVESMHEAVSNADAAALASHAHRLRGNSASIGARRVTRVCALIEESSRAGHLDSASDLLVRLDQALTEFQAAIAPVLD